MSSIAAFEALSEIPVYLKKLIDAFYAVALAFIQVLRLLEWSGISKKTTKAISRRIKSFTDPTSKSSHLGSELPDPHTSEIPGIVHADYAGAPPYSIAAVKASTEDLLQDFYGNPHSDTGWGTGAASSSAAIEQLRSLTLEMCNTDSSEYVCVLTSGATAALKLVGEVFPWTSQSMFVHLQDNHNSVLGIRELALKAGAGATGCLDASKVRFSEKKNAGNNLNESLTTMAATEIMNLLAYPLESNFNGTRYSEELVNAVENNAVELESGAITWHQEDGKNTNDDDGAVISNKNGRWTVLLDAAKACGTQPPDLSRFPAHFVALSFYKIFGYPSGLGALLIRRDMLGMLRKSYFSGGTVLSSSAETLFHVLRPDAAGFEDGTLPFLSIHAAVKGFQTWNLQGGFLGAQANAQAAASRFAGALSALKHANGAPVAVLYGQWSNLDSNNNSNGNEKGIIAGQGPTIAFNLLDAHGNWIGHRQVQRIASLEGIYLRTGAMCNPGACSTTLGINAVQAQEWYNAGHVCWDDKDVMDGKPTGAVRVSFGWGSLLKDAEIVLEMIQRHFVEQDDGVVASSTSSSSTSAFALQNQGFATTNQVDGIHNNRHLKVHSVSVYPIKSAAGFSPRSWPLSSTGLLYDRHWAVVDCEGKVLTQRRCPKLATLLAVIDLDNRMLKVSVVGGNGSGGQNSKVSSLEIPLPKLSAEEKESNADIVADAKVELCKRVESAAVVSINNAEEASEWLSSVLGMRCRLVEHRSMDNSGKEQNKGAEGSFANEAQVLLVSSGSLKVLQMKSGMQECSFESFAARFRPNIIVENVPKSRCPSRSASAALSTDVNSKETVADASINKVFNPYSLAEMVAFEEEKWSSVSIGDGDDVAQFEFESLGPCSRCEMICVDPKTGKKEGAEPLLTLARERKALGKNRMCLGVLLNLKESPDLNETAAVNRRIGIGMSVHYSTSN